MDFNDLQSVGWSKNTGVNIIEIYDNGKVKVVCENSLEHLPQSMVMANCFEKQPLESEDEQ